MSKSSLHDQALKANANNVIAKIKSGKTATASDLKTLQQATELIDAEKQSSEKAPKLSEIEVKIDDLMDWLCSGKRNLFNLEASGVVVKKAPGRYLLRDCVRNRIQDLLGKGSVTTSEREAEEQKKLVAERRLAENRADREAGIYISRALTVQLFRNNTMTARNRLLTIPDRIAQKVVVAPSVDLARKMIRDEINMALEDLAKLRIEDLLGAPEQDTEDDETRED